MQARIEHAFRHCDFSQGWFAVSGSLAGFCLRSAGGHRLPAAYCQSSPGACRPLPGGHQPSAITVAAKWTFRAILRVGDARVGQWSGPVSINVAL